jgi:hypothetical protein
MRKRRTRNPATPLSDAPTTGGPESGRFGEADKRAADLLLVSWALEQFVADRRQPVGEGTE